MTWDFHFPLKISVIAAAVIFLFLLWTARRRKWPFGYVAGAALLTSPIWFSILFFATYSIVRTVESGQSHYANYDAIGDVRIQWCMPSAATDISVVRPYSNGYCARFTISAKDITQWHNRVWEAHGRNTRRPENDMASSPDVTHADWPFTEFGWPLPQDLVAFHGPVAVSGAQYRIYFSEKEELAFLTSHDF